MYPNIALHILGWILEKLLKASLNIYIFFEARTDCPVETMLSQGEFQTENQTKLFFEKN